MDPLNLLKAQKKEEEQSKPPPSKASVGSLFADDDVAATLSNRAQDIPADPFAPLTASPPVSAGSPYDGGYPSAQRGGAFTPSDDPFRLVLNNAPGDRSGHDAAKAAFGDAAKAAGAAWGAVGAFLRDKAGPSLAASAASAAGGGGGHGGGGANSGLASVAARACQLPPSLAAAETVFDDMYIGEQVHVVVKNCFLLVANPLCELRGRLLATNYRLKFQTPKGMLRDELLWMREVKYFDVPMGMIEDLKQETTTTVTGMVEYRLKVVTKDLRTLVLLPSIEEDCRLVQDAVAAFGVPGNPTLLFAFRHAEAIWGSKAVPQDNEGWHIYEPEQEYARMGIETDLLPNATSPWRLSHVNDQYGLCSTYPAKLALPRRMTDSDLRAVAGFRKRGRLPAMSWCGGVELNFASLWRCSQTTEGLMGQKCHEDQKLVELIRQGAGNRTDRDLLVIDLRPWKAAWANKAGGGGFEGYPKCNLIFGGIDNIHAVRDGWRAMGAAVAAVSDGEVGTWFKDVANSGWYDYIGAILNSTLKVITEIAEQRCSVMVHCSDGWDRTAQTTSLSMLCLDASYRTQAGLLRLVQKEWCSFGHRFRTRMALGDAPGSEYSPVFIQWLECVYQIVRQTPNEFEFTPDILLRLASEVASNRFGTFLCDCEMERQQKVMPFAISLWSVLMRPDDAATWRNEEYKPMQRVIFPSVCQANYVVWGDYWWRFHPRGQKLKAGFRSQLAPPFGLFAALAPPLVPAPSSSDGLESSPDLPSPMGSASAPSAAAAAPSAGAVGKAASSPVAVDALRPTAGVGDLLPPEERESAPSPPKGRPPPKGLFAEEDEEDDVFVKRA